MQNGDVPAWRAAQVLTGLLVMAGVVACFMRFSVPKAVVLALHCSILANLSSDNVRRFFLPSDYPIDYIVVDEPDV